MYNPSRGGVRGGADQFTWESVKSDKHRENYLGHSLMAPVGRWQKGKDLSWYAKERKYDKTQEIIDRDELASIKKAEEEAMLIALGHNVVKKTQTLTKEDMREALKRNTERDDHQIERIDGVGAASQRIASLSGVRKDARQNNEGVAFEVIKERNISEPNDNDKVGESSSGDRKKNKKKSKKHKKEKKHKKHHKELHESDASPAHRTKYKSESEGENNRYSKVKHLEYVKHSQKDYLSDSSGNADERRSSNLKDPKFSEPRGRNYADSDSSDKKGRMPLKVRSHKKCKNRHKDYSSDSDSPSNVVQRKTKHKKSKSDDDVKKSSKEKSHKKSKHKHKDYSPEITEESSHSDSKKRHKRQKESVKRCRHDTSESD